MYTKVDAVTYGWAEHHVSGKRFEVPNRYYFCVGVLDGLC